MERDTWALVKQKARRATRCAENRDEKNGDRKKNEKPKEEKRHALRENI